jgi:RND family efflux transporter MFP subunit
MLRDRFFPIFFFIFMLLLGGLSSHVIAANPVTKSIPARVPVRVAEVQNRIISEQIALIGTTEPFAASTIASEFSGVVEYFPVKEGDFVKKRDLLVRLRSTGLKLRLKAAVAARERVKANLENAEADLKRLFKLMESDSISTRRHEEADYVFRAFKQELLKNNAEIEYLQYEIDQKEVVSPFSGFVTKEHTQVGEWMQAGGSVVTIQNLGQIRVTVDVPERYAVMLKPKDDVKILVKSISGKNYSGKIYAILSQGDPNTRTFPVRIHLPNPKYTIKSGMEARVTFKLSETKNALVVPKDAVVTVQNKLVVYTVVEGKAIPVGVDILGYDDGDASIKGKIKPGDPVIIRGNERLRPGVPIQILK